MPIYEFDCHDCGADFEVICSYHTLVDVRCVDCLSASITRRVSVSSFQLKGTGWARDRYGLAETSTADASSMSSDSVSGGDSQ